MVETERTAEEMNEIFSELKEKDPDSLKMYEEYKGFKVIIEEYLGLKLPVITEVTVSSGTVTN